MPAREVDDEGQLSYVPPAGADDRHTGNAPQAGAHHRGPPDLNDAIPQDLGFVDRSDPEPCFDPEINFVVGKKQLGKIIDKCITNHGFTVSAERAGRHQGPGLPLLHRGLLTVAIAI